MFVRYPLALSVFCLSLILSCSAKEATYTVEEVDGVRHVHNLAPRWDNEVMIGLEFVQKIGELDSDDENYLLHNPSDVVVDSKGNIIILDSGNFLVKKFTADGKFILKFGERGQGPGEFSGVYKMDIDENDYLYILDGRNSALHKFDSNGNFIQSLKGKTGQSLIALLSNGTIVRSVTWFESENNIDETPLIEIIDDKETLVASFGNRKIFDDSNMKRQGNAIHLVSDNKDNIYGSFLLQNRIEKFDKNGKIIMRISRELPYQESEKFRIVELPNSSGRFFTPNIFTNGIQVDNHGRIWVKTYERQMRQEEFKKDGLKENIMKLEVFDKSGVLLANIKNEYMTDRSFFKVFEDRLFAIEAQKTMAVYEYKIIEK